MFPLLNAERRLEKRNQNLLSRTGGNPINETHSIRILANSGAG
jgi:hypothetical protein